MNIHNPQHPKAIAEEIVLMDTKQHIVSNQNNAPIIGLNMDSLVGPFIATNFDEERMTWQHFFDCLLYAEHQSDNTTTSSSASLVNSLPDFYRRAHKYYPSFILRTTSKKPTKSRDNAKKIKRVSYTYSPNFKETTIPSKMAFSVLFPSDFTYSKETGTNSSKPVVKIVSGIILPDSGPLCKKVIGARSGNSIIHMLWKEYSPEVACDFISQTQLMVYWYLTLRGFSMGLSDTATSSIAKEQIRRSLLQTEAECEAILNSNEDPDRKERQLNQRLNDSMNDISTIVAKNLQKGERNAQTIMRKSGAKGQSINSTQISGIVGQQNVGGKRMTKQLTYGTRTLPHFRRNDDSIAARGFVASNYLEGLKHYEAFFTAAGGREGIISTAIKTGDIGYLQKRIARKLEDLRISIDGSVRDANGTITQFLYGDDAFDPKMVYNVPGLSFPFFVNPTSLANRINSRYEAQGSDEKMRTLTEKELTTLENRIQVGLQGTKFQTPLTRHATERTRSILRKTLKNVEVVAKEIPTFCDEIVRHFYKSTIEHGENIGLSATSAIGEPATQLSLSSFHMSGVGSKQNAGGLPRLNELLSVSKKPRTPSCTIYLKDGYLSNITSETLKLNELLKKQADEKKQEQVRNQIQDLKNNALRHLHRYREHLEFVSVSMLLDKIELRYVKEDDEDIDLEQRVGSIASVVQYQEYVPAEWVERSKMLGFSQGSEKKSRWVVTLHFNLKKLYNNRVELRTIAEAIETHNPAFSCCYSPMTTGQVDVFYDFASLAEETKEELEGKNYKKILTPENVDYFLVRDFVRPYLRSIPIRGVEGISRIYPREDTKTKEWIIETEGSNLRGVLALNSIPIDKQRTISDSLGEVLDVFDIDVSQSVLISEIHRVICFDGTYINPKHVSLLGASMARSGILSRVSRDGIERNAGPISKGTFEKNIDSFVESGVFTETDHAKSFSASVMFGISSHMGTGAVQLRSIEE